MAFNERPYHNEWETSDIRRWLNNKFYKKLSDDEKEIIFKNRELDDNIFLLSDKEYEKFRNDIPLLRGAWWWLRSPSYDTDCAQIVDYDGYFCYNGDGVRNSSNGVRPALLV